jgi:phosphodiesterase/alkaline phosphatase D-like protein
MLDTRYHRDSLLSDGTILGDPQWQWLERELHGPQSEITIIGSFIQVNILCFRYILIEVKSLFRSFKTKSRHGSKVAE